MVVSSTNNLNRIIVILHRRIHIVATASCRQNSSVRMHTILSIDILDRMRLNYTSKNNDVFLLIILTSNHNGFEVYLDRCEKRYQRSLARSRFVINNDATVKQRAVASSY